MAAAIALGFFWLSALSSQLSASASDQAAPDDTFSKPLTTTVARLAEQPALSAKDCADLAQTTLTYGERLKSSQQKVSEMVVHDALAAVSLGERADAKAADWPKLRRDLEALLEKPPEQDKKDQDQQDQQQQQQNQDRNQPQQSQDQQNRDQQQKQDQQQNQQQQDQQNQSQEQQEKQQQDAFGDMKESEQEKKPDDQQQPPPPQPQTQKVGGQKKEKAEAPTDPELAMPLQKLEQVRNQDSPARLQQIMQGQPQKTQKKGKDW